MKTTAKSLSAMALSIAIIGTGTAAYAYQNPEVTSKFIPSFAQEEQDSPEEIAAEKAEAAKLAPQAKISEAQAKTTAQKAYAGNGTLKESQLEDENGSIIYGIQFTETDGNEVEVKVDAKTGKVLKIEDDRNETEDTAENDSNDESGEENEAPETAESEAAESARLAPEAKITQSQAKQTALSTHTGNVNNIVLEDEDGQIVYGVEYTNGDEVKVDAKTGKVVKVEQGGEHDNEDHVEARREDEYEEEDNQK